MRGNTAAPALLDVQKNLLYLALSNLDAALFQVMYQFKTVSTALFSCALLGRRFSCQQTSGLVLLTAGLMLVEGGQAGEGKAAAPHSSGEGQYAAAAAQSHLVGLAAVAGCCCTSGFASVYFERVLKAGPSLSVVAKNFQLATCALGFALLFGLAKDAGPIAANGFFAGYTPVVWATILLEAGGGLLVGFVLKYADAMLKTFATAISIVTSVLLSTVLLGFWPSSALFPLGALTVVVASALYTAPSLVATDGDHSCGLGGGSKASHMTVCTAVLAGQGYEGAPMMGERTRLLGGNGTTESLPSSGDDDGTRLGRMRDAAPGGGASYQASAASGGHSPP